MEHIRHALKLGQSGEQGMSDIAFVPNALPEAHLDGISLHTRIGELAMSSPILINAMTGGAPETEAINRELAVAARETGIAMAVGSQMAAIRNPDLAASYRVVRSVNPDGLVFGNLGGEATVDEAMRAVEMLRADALQIHLNAMQELIMPEGDRDFRGRLERIQAIAEACPSPSSSRRSASASPANPSSGYGERASGSSMSAAQVARISPLSRMPAESAARLAQ